MPQHAAHRANPQSRLDFRAEDFRFHLSMNWLRLPILLGTWVALLAAAPVAAGPFVAPAEGPVVFRRDRLPLDADTMTELADQLAILANAQGGDEAVKRRAVAQMLALALALQPGHSEALRIMEKFQNGIQKAWGDAGQLAAASAEVWQIRGWLEMARHEECDAIGGVLLTSSTS